jgi:hypothetical protein
MALELVASATAALPFLHEPAFTLLLILVLLVGAEHDLAVERQGLEQKVEPLTVFVRERHTEVEPVVILVLALDDGVSAICGFRHDGILHAVGPMTPHTGIRVQLLHGALLSE